MILTKISQSELFDAMIERLPLRPADGGGEGRAPMTGEEIRAAFDRAPKLIAAALDRLIDELEGGALGSLPLGDEDTLTACLARIKAQGEACEAAVTEHGSRLDAQGGKLTELQGKSAELTERIAAIENTEIDFSPYAKVSDVYDGLSLILAALGEAEVTV